MATCINLIEASLVGWRKDILSLLECNEVEVINADSLLAGFLNGNFLNNFNSLDNFLRLSSQLVAKVVDLVVQVIKTKLLEVVCSVAGEELVVQTNKETYLCSAAIKVNSVARTIGKVPVNSRLYIELPCLLCTKIP